MKLFLVGLLFFTSIVWEVDPICDQLKFDVLISNTSSGQNNGKIEVVLENSGESNVRAYLYGDKRSKNKLDKKIDELTSLSKGTYILVLQNSECSSMKSDIVIE